MIAQLLKTQNFITGHTIIFFRVILFLVFLGHGLVSLGYSPGYQLHYSIFESINFWGYDTATFLKYQGSFDIVLAVLILLGLGIRYVLTLALVYLVSVATA